MDLFAEVWTKGDDDILCACRAEMLGLGWTGSIIGFRCICGALPVCFESGNFYLDSQRCACERKVVIRFGPSALGAMIFCPNEPEVVARIKQTPKRRKLRRWSNDAAFLKECGIKSD